MTPFQEALFNEIKKTITAARRSGTVAMSMDCLMMGVRTPGVLRGAPMGTNAPYYYKQMFREMVNSTPAFKRFICEA